MQFVDLDGITIHYADSGARDVPVLVFINSLGTDFRIWDGVAARLESRYRMVRYDKRGHGLSDAPPGPYKLDDHVDDLFALLDFLDLGRTSIAGVSVGGMIAQRFHQRAPERVRSLVLSDTGARIGDAELWNERIETVRNHGIYDIADSVLARWFAPEFRAEEPARWRAYRNMLARTTTEGYASTCAAIRDADLRQAASEIRCPTLVVTGREDAATPIETGRALASLIPGSRFEIIEDAGHLPCLEQPQVLSRLMCELEEGTDLD